MSTIAERIIEIVEDKGGNMSNFARKLNLTPSYISKFRNYPDSIPSDRTIHSICKEFSVNEEWLRTGTGTKYIPVERETEVAEIMAKMYHEPEDSYKYRFQKLVSEMDENQIKQWYDWALKIVESRKDLSD